MSGQNITFKPTDSLLRNMALPGKVGQLVGDLIKLGLGGNGNPLAASGGGSAMDFAALLDKQMQVQMEMQVVSMESNTSRSEHESRMTPLRNLRLN